MAEPQPTGEDGPWGQRRVVTNDGWRITQVRQRDGSWWNAVIERVGG